MRKSRAVKSSNRKRRGANVHRGKKYLQTLRVIAKRSEEVKSLPALIAQVEAEVEATHQPISERDAYFLRYLREKLVREKDLLAKAEFRLVKRQAYEATLEQRRRFYENCCKWAP